MSSDLAFSLETLDVIFNGIERATLESGGDGSGLIISKQFRELADAFERYEAKQSHPWFTNRSEYNGVINFANGQESISFTDAREPEAEKFCEIIVELW